MSEQHYDVGVIGGGLGGIYASHRFTQLGLSVIGFEGGSSFGGVWFHNAYPGAATDTDCVDYCFHFSAEIYNGWRWKDRYSAQPVLLEYLNWVADECDVRGLFRFNNWLTEARWSSVDNRWHLLSSEGERAACRFVIMCTGQLTDPRPPIPGLERFRGEWVRASRWPEHEVSFKGRRIGIVGTGSTGVQAVPVLAQEAEQLFVFQRTPHYSVPARQGPIDPALQDHIGQDVLADRERQWTLGRSAWASRYGPSPAQPLAEYTTKDVADRLEEQWNYGGHGMSYLFSDEAVSRETNDVVAEFVRQKIRETIKDPVVAETMCPRYPIGTHRLGLGTNFYETFNEDHVALIDVASDPIVEITETGVRTAGNHYEVDLLILALGFHAFSGALDAAGLLNEKNQLVSDIWKRGPRTLLGLMVPGFPNMFTPTGPGSPSVLARLFLQNEFHIEWIADCFEFMQRNGYTTIEPTEGGSDEWGKVVASYAENILRRQEDNYMVHVNGDDGSRIFIPFYGGLNNYVPKARAIAANDYEGFAFA